VNHTFSRLIGGLAAAVLAVGCSRGEPVADAPVRFAVPAGDGETAGAVSAPEPVTVGLSPVSVDRGLLNLSGPELWARWNALRGDPYELDAVDRFLEDQPKRLKCADQGIVEYSGTTLRYLGSVRVNEPFRDRLVRFEEVVSEVATEVYGRPPRRIRHLGAFSCRRSRNRSHRLSEHALGNAIDIAGFDFGPVAKDEPLPAELPRQLRGGFSVRVAKHWNRAGSVQGTTHARFLRELTGRLLERADIFRVAIGPSHRGHHDHFHFDVSPWRYVDL
jgi:hypothetical protein